MGGAAGDVLASRVLRAEGRGARFEYCIQGTEWCESSTEFGDRVKMSSVWRSEIEHRVSDAERSSASGDRSLESEYFAMDQAELSGEWK